MVKKKRFPDEDEPKNLAEEKRKMSPEVLASFEKLPKTSFMFVGHYIFVGVHLSSSAEKNARDVGLLMETLPEMMKSYPGCQLVCGGDVNSYFGPDRSPIFKQGFEMYPSREDEHTTIKQRTRTQAQWKKAELKVEESKDKVMSTLRVKGGKIVLINGDETRNKNILPSDNHPFDHFAVVTTLSTRH